MSKQNEYFIDMVRIKYGGYFSLPAKMAIT